MICPSCNNNIENISETNCPECGWRFNEEDKINRTIIGSLSRPKQSIVVNIAITIDRTASSTQFETGIKTVLESVVRDLDKNIDDMVFHFYTHGNLDQGQQTVLHTDGGSANQVIDDFKHVKFEGGGYPKEDHLSSIEHLMNNTPWRSRPGQSHSAIIAIMTAESKPCKSGKSAIQLGEELKKRKINLYMLCEVTPLLYSLAKSANGLIFPISNSPELSDLEIISQQLTSSITISALSGDTEPMQKPTSNDNNP